VNWAPPVVPLESPPGVGADSDPFFSLLLTLLAFLVVIVAAWLGTRWLVRRLYGPGAAGQGRVKVLERIPLEPRRTLYLVQAGEKRLLLGATDQQIRVLGEFAKDELPEPPAPPVRTFRETLRALRGG
jgi:flagellar protein FliO/FliZ